MVGWMIGQAAGATDAPAPQHGGGALSILDSYLWIFLTALMVSFCLTPLMRRLAIRNGIVDRPDMKRKAHAEPVAYMGGVAIFIGWMVGVFLCFFIAPHDPLTVAEVSFPISVILGAAAITITGLMDDIYGVSPRVKIGGQFFAAAALAWQNIGFSLVNQVFAIIGLDLPPGIAYILGTAMLAGFVLGGCNAVNLIDGLDGLASGVVAIATAGFLFMALTLSVRAAGVDPTPGTVITDPVRIVMCLAILGAVLGFLPFNFNPANIFMGDAGSLLLGYLSVATILMFADSPLNNGPLFVTAALIVFALPIMDTALAIVRRKIAGKPIFSPDDQHLHHQALRGIRRLGITSPRLSVKLAVLSMYALGLTFAVLGCALVALDLRSRYVITVFVVLVCSIGVWVHKAARQRQLRLDAAQSDPLAEAPAPGEVRTTELHPAPRVDSPAGVHPAPATPEVAANSTR